MLLVLDVGNTNIVIGLYQQDTLTAHWRIRTQLGRTADEHAMLFLDLFKHAGIAPSSITDAVVSSVVPPMDSSLHDALCDACGIDNPLFITAALDLGIHVAYHNPQEVGADRIINAIAADAKYGHPAIVVDFGTATTLDVLDADGRYLGGAIMPGMETSAEALFRAAARLPRISLEAPGTAIGRTTVESMQSGLMLGYAGGIDALVDRIRTELECDMPVIATGGLASRVAAVSRTIQHVEPWLTLEGLNLAWKRVRGGV